mgnify:FL=1
MAVVFTQKELEDYLAEWQKRLCLDAWDVRIGIYRERAFDGEGRSGEISYSIESGKAVIKLLDPVDYPDEDFPQDMEVTLVHELLHLKFAAFTPQDDTLEHRLFEQTVESMANLLVALKREKYESGKDD